MMDRTKGYFLLIDRYINNELTDAELKELEIELKHDATLAEELMLQLEISQAIQEHDIRSLRENVNCVIHNIPIAGNRKNLLVPDKFNFELAEDLTSAQNFNGKVDIEDIQNFTQSIPKIHLYQHISAAKENIYQFYKEQYRSKTIKNNKSNSSTEDSLFEDIKNAVQEKDLIDIRANLNQIAASMTDHFQSTDEIDSYVNNQMNKELRSKFEERMQFDSSLANDVHLFKEVDLAMSEKDIMDLRASLQELKVSELETTSEIEKIEGYLYEELCEADMASFEATMNINRDLHLEVDLVQNVDKALQENDIMQLRDNLRMITSNNVKQKKTERSVDLRFRHRKLAYSLVAASIVLLLGITGILSKSSSDGNIYKEFYTKYETTGISRSSNPAADQTLTLALQKFNNQDYKTALNLLQEVISRDKSNIVGRFYSGVSLQELGKYGNAIKEYEVVVVDKDNLFVEQAEWYIGLCYLQTNENKKAIKQFKKIANSKGFYQQKAEAILKKMKINI